MMPDLHQKRAKQQSIGSTDLKNTRTVVSEVYFSDTPQGKRLRMEWLKSRGLLEFVSITAHRFFDGVLPTVPGCFQRVFDVFEEKTLQRVREGSE